MDSGPSIDDVGFGMSTKENTHLQPTDLALAFRCHRIHAVDLLEEKILSYEPFLLGRLYWT
jgi:hypothetical protein